MIGTAVESRATRWNTVSAAPAAETAHACPVALLAARARVVAGSAATQARVAERRSEDSWARLRGVAAVGAAAAVASLACAAVVLLEGVVPDIVTPTIRWIASATAVLFAIAPAALLVRAAASPPILDEAPRAAMASATTLASLGAGFGRAIEAVDAQALPEVVRTMEALLTVLETEAGTVARSARPRNATAPARRHQRIVPLERRVVVTTVDGRKLMGTIADVSLSGVALTASLPRVAIGDPATVGSRLATVARLWDRGIAFQFARELDPTIFDEAIVL